MKPTENPSGVFLGVTGTFAAVGHQRVVEIAGVNVPRQRQLPLVVDALDALRLGSGFGQGRQQQRCQHRNNGDDDQQFDQRKRRTRIGPRADHSAASL